jgi:hypothetical protein
MAALAEPAAALPEPMAALAMAGMSGDTEGSPWRRWLMADLAPWRRAAPRPRGVRIFSPDPIPWRVLLS